MFGDDLIFEDYRRWASNLRESTEAKKRFDDLISKQASSYPYKIFWDIPISGDYFWISPFTSPSEGPLAGLVRYRNWYQFDNEDLPGTEFKKIPKVLRESQQWIWLKHDTSQNVFSYKPNLCRGVKEGDGLLPCNWMKFSPIDWHYKISGGANGYVLNDSVIEDDLRLVAIVIHPTSGLSNNDVRTLWIALGKPYLEYSKDMLGWKILGLVNKQLPSINIAGVKIFTGGDYVELSGLGAVGSLIDISDCISALHGYRFPASCQPLKTYNPRPMTPREEARLKEMLSFISADCSYDTYIRVIWGILSTGWPIAEQIALDWSMTAPHRFEQKTFDDLVKSYNPARSGAVTMGTVHHLAKAGGWHG